MKSRHSRAAVTTMLIDPLEQRLLYSADHPLGLAVALDDDTGYQDDLQADHLTALLLAASIDQAEPEAPRAVAFVETQVPDFAELSDRLESQGIVVHVIDSTESGVDQVTDALSRYSELDSVMVFSHGVESGFLLGNDIVNSDFLSTVESEVQAWGNALADDGDLLLFGCDVAEDEAGRAFLGRLAELTQADVAASDDTTGHVDRGGNWDLEWTSGTVNTTVLDSAVLDDWQGSLASIIVTTTLDTVDAGDLTSYAALQGDKGADNEISLREAVEVANNDASVSLISLSGGADYVLTSAQLSMSGTYTVAGVGAVDTVIDQQDTRRVVRVTAGADITLTNLTLTGGDAVNEGGGLHIVSTATARLESVIIRNNVSAIHGGGIYNAGLLVAQDVRLTQNTAAEHGGGIYTIANMTLNRVTIDDNTSIRDGGGIHQQGDGQSSTLDYVTISGNDGVRGGGISAKGEVIIRNSTIVGNTAVTDGAGIREHGSETITLYNTVLADNTQSGGVASEDDIFGEATSLGFNFIENEGSIVLAATDIQGADPGLSGLVLDAGGIIKTHVPTADSPLINRGGSVGTLVDATGNDIDTIPDIGAHEVQGPNGAMFWTDGISQIFRSDATGNYAQTVLTGLDAPLDLEVDEASGRMYWLEENTHFVRSALLDGSDVQTHFTAGISATSIALDISAGNVYISEVDGVGNIYRYQLSDGSSLLITVVNAPTDIEFDVGGNTLHWLEANVIAPFIPSKTSINHFNLTTFGRTSEDIDAITEISEPSALVLNAASDRLYWVDSNSNPDPGILGVQNLTDLQIDSVNTVSTATGIAFDSLNDRVLVTTGIDGRILSFNEGLGDSQELFSSVNDAGSIAYLVTQSTAPQLIANTGATLDEGSSTTFSEATLLYEDDDTDSINLTYTITTEPVEGEIQKSGVKVSTFTQEDIDEELITYLNNGNHVGYDTDWIDSFIFQLNDGISTFSNQQFNFTINDVPDTLLLQANTGSSQNEGSTKVLTSTELSYSDVDTAPADINYTATSHPGGGKLLVNSVEQLTFTQDDLDNNRVAYQDAGAHEGVDASWTESFTFSVTDGTYSFDDQSFVLAINNVPDTLLLQANTGSSQNEGATKVLTSSELSYSDVDTAPADIDYAVTLHPAGGKLLVSGVEQLTFTQDDLDNNRVAYRDDGDHEGVDASWTESFTFSVTDGTYSFDDQSFVLAINNVPDPLVLQANNGMSLNEGESKVLTLSELNVTDVDTASSDINYSVSDMPASGAFFVGGVEQLTFTQTNLENGEVAYRDDGSHAGFESSWTESFEFSVTDGTTSIANQKFTLTINDVPGAPVLQINNGLSLREGELKVITTSELTVTDVDTPPSAITFTVTAQPAGGKLLVGGLEQLTFTQEDLNNGDVAYQDAGTHEGFESSWTQSFDFSVTDSVHSIYSQSFDMTIADVPDALVLQANTGLSLDEGDIRILTPSELNVTDVDTAPSAIIYTASAHPAGGKLLVAGVKSLVFTQDNLNNGEVAYRDDGFHAGFETIWTESFDFSVTDGTTSTVNQKFTLTINDVPDAPVFSPSVGVLLQEGGLMTLTAAHLTVTDVDTGSENIAFAVTASSSGQLLVDGNVANTFSHSDVLAGRVAFQHDGSESSRESSVSFSVSDGTIVLPADTLVFSIMPVHDETPVAKNHDLSGNRGDLMSELQTGSLTLLDGVSDNDEPVGTLLVRLETAALHGAVSIDADGTFSYQHDGTETFLDSFTYTVTDEGGNASAAAVVTIDISGNTTPVATGSIDPQSAIEMQVFTLTLDSSLFSDTADDALVWQASEQDGSALPQWLSFDSVRRTFSGTPGDADTGDIELRVHAVDTQGAESAPVLFTLTVTDANQTPSLSVASQSTVEENQPGVAVTTINANDPDLTDKLTVSVDDSRFQITGNLLSLKPGVSLDHESEPEVLLTISATDESGETATSLLPVRVLDANDAPVVATDTRAVVLGTDAATAIPVDWFTDQDGNSLTYTWKLASGEALPDWIIFDQQSMTLSLGKVPENASTQSVILMVDDGSGGVVQLFLDLQLPTPVLAPAKPVVEPATVESEAEVVLSTIDLADLSSDKSTTNVGVSKEGQIPDNSRKSETNSSVAALGVSASGVIPLIVDIDPVSSEDLSERIQSIKNARVISDQIGDAFKNKRANPSTPSLPDVLHPATNLNELFSAVQRQDSQTLSELAREFERQRQEMQSRENFNSAVVGSSITLSSGLSVGYLIYLVRGGAIVSSMLSSLPAWRFVDPLPILSSMNGDSDADGETLASIVSENASK